MKQNEPIDDLFQRRFQPDFSEEIPQEFLLDVNRKLDELAASRSKKRTIVYWWLSVFLLFFGLGLAAFQFKKDSPVSSNTLLNKLKTTNKVATRLPNESIQKHGKPENDLDLTTNQTRNTAYVSINELSSYKKSVSKNQNGINQKEEKTQKELEINQDLAIQTKLFQMDSSKMVANSPIEHVDKSPSFNDSLRVDTITHATKPKMELKPKDVENSKSSNRNHALLFYTGISGVGQLVFKPNSAIQTSTIFTPKSFQEKRQSDESEITSWDLAIKYSYQYRKFIFSVGLEYFVWGEKTNYSNVNYTAQFENTYRYIAVPIQVGRMWKLGKYAIQPSTGISLGCLIQPVNGYYLNFSNSNVAFQSDISKLTGTLHGAVEFSYYSQSGIKVSLMPLGRFSLGGVVQSNIVRTNYFSLGMQLGIGYCW